MWDLQITNSLSLIKNKKLNILQIGSIDNEYTKWLLNNIMIHNDSKLYILNLCYQFEKNRDMIHKNTKSISCIIDSSFKKYSNKIVQIKKKSEDMFEYFKENKFYFDLILIDYTYLSNPLTYLILSWELLNNNGIILLSNINKHNSYMNIIQTFLSTYEKNIHFIELNNYILIKKNILNKNYNDLPIYIKQIFEKYLKFKEYGLVKNIPKNNIKNINWNFELNDNFSGSINKKYGYNYEIEKYEDYIYSHKKKYIDLKSIDINYFLVFKKKDILSIKKNINQYKNIMKKNNIFQNKIIKLDKYININYNFLLDNLYKNNNFVIKKNRGNIFILSTLTKKSELIDYFENKNKKVYKLTSEKDSKNKKNVIYIKSTNNLFDINNFINISQKYRSNFEHININLFRYISTNDLILPYKNYSNILLSNILYLILNIQKTNGELYLILSPLTNTVQIQFLQILSNYYEKITLENYFNYSNHCSILIHVSKFKGISKTELDNLYESYYPFYEKNIEPHIDQMFLGNKIEGLYLDNIISNKLDIKIVKTVTDFNKQYYKEFLENLKMKIDIYDFLHNKTTSKEQKDYIYNKLFQTQYNRFIEEYRKLYLRK